jgi:hypothetical protein
MSQVDSKVASSVPAEASPGSLPTPRPRLRWFQFRLRTLMVLLFILSVLLAAYVWRRERARRQSEAVATLRRLGHTVYYDYHWRKNADGTSTSDENHPSLVPKWLLALAGYDFFHDAVSVYDGHRPLASQDVDEFWRAWTPSS